MFKKEHMGNIALYGNIPETKVHAEEAKVKPRQMFG